MKYLRQLYIPLIAFSMMLVSCEDAFETTLTIDPPEHIDRLVMHAYGSTNDNDLQVSLSKSTPLLSSNTPSQISNAIVTLWKGDALIATLEEVNNGFSAEFNYILPSGTIVYEKGSTYRLEAEATGFEKIIGRATVPNDVPLQDLRYEEEGTSLEPGDFNSEVEIDFEDAPQEENFYEIGLRRFVENFGNPFYREIDIDTFDPAAQEGISYANLIVNDLSFDGESKTLPIIFNRQSSQAIDDLFVLWRVTSEDHYLFNKTARRQINTEENPFSTPVQIYSNIENGIGIFSIVNEQLIKVVP